MADSETSITDTRKRHVDRMADLYRAHAPDAFRVAHLLTGDPAAAEDVTQDAFVRLFGRFGHLYSRDKFEAHLRRTVVNLCRDRFRRDRTLRRYLSGTAKPAATPDPSDAVAEREATVQALRRLGYKQRAAIVLRYYADLTEADAAAALDLSPKAFRSLLARARRGLKEELQGGRD